MSEELEKVKAERDMLRDHLAEIKRLFISTVDEYNAVLRAIMKVSPKALGQIELVLEENTTKKAGIQ